MIEKEMNFRINYRLTKASDELLAKIYAERMWILDFRKCLNWRQKLCNHAAKKIPEILKNYNWAFANQLSVWEGHNIVPSVLRNELASLIAGNTVVPTFKANYIALWSGSTTPANTDTTLVAETLRQTFSNRFSVDNVAYLDKFFSSGDVGWLSVSEIGVFVDWTASADTWYLFSRILANEVMAVTETLTINATFSIV